MQLVIFLRRLPKYLCCSLRRVVVVGIGVVADAAVGVGVAAGAAVGAAASAGGGLDFDELASTAVVDPKQLVRNVVEAAGWKMVESDDVWQVTLPIGSLRKQTVRIVTPCFILNATKTPISFNMMPRLEQTESYIRKSRSWATGYAWPNRDK